MQQAASFRSTAEMMRDALKGLSPSLINQVTPLAEQFLPIYFDIAQGHREFTPSPQETRQRIKSYYGHHWQLHGSAHGGNVGIRRNLLIQFNDDNVDETEILESLLKEATMSTELDLTVRSLIGDHGRPMQPTVVDLPPDVTRVAHAAFNTGGGFLSQLSKMAADAGQSDGSARLDRLSKDVSGMADMFSSASRGGLNSRVISLADEIAVWMGVGGVVAQGQKFLTAKDTS